MKTVKINVYTLLELSDEAQEKAHTDYLYNGFEPFGIDEDLESIKEFAQVFFGVGLKDWNISTYERSFIKTDATQEHFRGIKPAEITDSDLTGHCLDGILVDAFQSSVKEKGDVKSAFFESIEAGISYLIKDVEYQESFDYFAEHSEANDYEYLVSGKFYY